MIGNDLSISIVPLVSSGDSSDTTAPQEVIYNGRRLRWCKENLCGCLIMTTAYSLMGCFFIGLGMVSYGGEKLRNASLIVTGVGFFGTAFTGCTILCPCIFMPCYTRAFSCMEGRRVDENEILRTMYPSPFQRRM